MTKMMKNVFENLASLKEEEAKAYRELAKAVDEDKSTSEGESKDEKPVAKKSSKKPVEKTKESEITFEQLKTLFAEKSQAGHTSELKEILKKLGAVKLSGVKPEDYETAFLAASEL